MTEPMTLDAWQPLTQGAVFRQLLQAFSYPGRVATVAEKDSALAHVLATLIDTEVTLADPHQLVEPRLLALLEARPAEPELAQFVVACADSAPRFTPALGTLEAPEQGATLVLCVERLGEGQALSVSGPGVDGTLTLRVQGLNPAWLAARATWSAHFPLGVDIILVDRERIAALPRTSCVNLGEH